MLRLPGIRVTHRVKMNWIKMVDKAGSVLRVETVINPLRIPAKPVRIHDPQTGQALVSGLQPPIATIILANTGLASAGNDYL